MEFERRELILTTLSFWNFNFDFSSGNVVPWSIQPIDADPIPIENVDQAPQKMQEVYEKPMINIKKQ